MAGRKGAPCVSRLDLFQVVGEEAGPCRVRQELVMTDMMCGYGGDRDEILVAYVYGDIEPAGSEAFDAHLTKCVHCRTELAGLRGVRAKLKKWAPPEPLRALTASSAPPA